MNYVILSVEQRGKLIGKWEEGATYIALAEEFSVSESTVRGIVKRYKERDTIQRKNGSGRKTLLTDRDVRVLVRNVKASPYTPLTKHAQVLASVTGVPVSRKTISLRLKDNGLSSCSAARTLLLSKTNTNKRLIWAQAHDWSTEEWGRVAYSDESRFSQFSDGNVRVIRPKGARYDPKYTVPTVKQCSSVMVWGCFWRGGVGPLFILTEIMDQDVYVNTLSKCFFSWKKSIRASHNVDLLLLGDNARPHKGGYATWWKRMTGIETVDWPAQSPDLNPIENLWGIIKRRLQERGHIFSNMNMLVETLREEWNKIEPDLCRRLSDGMIDRVRKTVDNKGHSIGK